MNLKFPTLSVFYALVKISSLRLEDKRTGISKFFLSFFTLFLYVPWRLEIKNSALSRQIALFCRLFLWKVISWIFFLYRYRYAPPDSETPQISFAAHLAGVVAGLTFGLVILKNYEQKLSERRVWWLTLLVLFILSFTAFLYQRLRPNPALTLFCVGHRCPPSNSWPQNKATIFMDHIYM